ncbi:MAG: NADH:ubiquinone reductase (Na(+)-transporting) subunit F, partial [Bacteroidales bacterium]|nr:NADH:ubiquinone reductase (Na(+)-transporting) subunit F [Bacteroidales bacterium]
MILLDIFSTTLGVAVAIFFVVILLLVILLLVAKAKLLPSGKVKITINGDKEVEVEQGGSLLQTL